MNAPAGQRFAQFYERQQARRSPILNSLRFFAAVFTLVIGITLASEIVPALLLLSVSALLFVGESRWVAECFDTVEGFVNSRRARVLGARRDESEPAPAPKRSKPRGVKPRVSRVRGERYNSHLLAMDAARALLREQSGGAAAEEQKRSARETERAREPNAASHAREPHHAIQFTSLRSDPNGVARVREPQHADDCAALRSAANAANAEIGPDAARGTGDRTQAPDRAAPGATVRRVRITPSPTVKLWSWEDPDSSAAQPARHAGLIKNAPVEHRQDSAEPVHPFAPTAPMRTIVICAPPVPAAESER